MIKVCRVINTPRTLKLLCQPVIYQINHVLPLRIITLESHNARSCSISMYFNVQYIYIYIYIYIYTYIYIYIKIICQIIVLGCINLSALGHETSIEVNSLETLYSKQDTCCKLLVLHQKSALCWISKKVLNVSNLDR